MFVLTSANSSTMGELINTSAMCLDNYGQYVLPGRRFQPISSDHCIQCVCLNSKPENCLTIQCRPPDNCKKSAVVQKKGSCCEFICLNQDEDDDSDKLTKLSSIKKYSTLESKNKNTLDQFNDLDANGNLQNNIKSINVHSNSLTGNVQNHNEQKNAKNLRSSELLLKMNGTKDTVNDRRYSHLENTLKKLILNKNLKTHLNEENKNSSQTKFNDDKFDQRPVNPAFQMPFLGLGVGIGNGNSDSSEIVQPPPPPYKPKQQRINYSTYNTNYNQTIYSPPSNKYSSSTYLGNEQIRHAGKKYGIYGSTIYQNNLNNNYNQLNHNSSQFPDDHPLLNELMRARQFNRNYVTHHTSDRNMNLNTINNNSIQWFNAHSLGLRLIASTVCTFLILALLFFLIHRLRQRRLLILIRRLQNRRESNGQHMFANGLPFVQGDPLNRGGGCFVEGPPSYFSGTNFWKPICNIQQPNEPPPPYEHHPPSFSNPLLNINPTTDDPTLNQLTCFNSTTSNLLGNGICFNTIDRTSNLQTNVNNTESINSTNNNNSTNNYDVPFTNGQLNSNTSLKTNQVRTNQPVHFDFMNGNNLTNIKSFNKNLAVHTAKWKNYLQMKENQMDKLRSIKSQQIPTSTRALENNNELMEAQNLNNTIIEDQLFKSSASLLKSDESSARDNSLRLFINNGGQNDQQDTRTSNQIHSQSVDNLSSSIANKSIGNHLLDFYNNNLANRSNVFNPTYSSIQKPDKSRYNSNLSLKSKYHRCVVNIPNLPTVFKSSLSNQTDYKIDSDLTNLDDNFNSSFTEALGSPPSPAPPQVPERKVSLPVELRNEEFTNKLHRNYSNEQANQHDQFNYKSDLKNQTKYLSFNHSTPTINSQLDQLRYNLYMNKLKQDELEQEKEKPKQSDHLEFNNCDINNDNQLNDNDDNLLPSTSTSPNTTRIMINYKK